MIFSRVFICSSKDKALQHPTRNTPPLIRADFHLLQRYPTSAEPINIIRTTYPTNTTAQTLTANVKLRNKFILGFLPLLILIAIFCTIGIRAFFSINQLISGLQDKIAPNAQSMLELKKVLTSLDGEIMAKRIDRLSTEENINKLRMLVKQHLAQAEHSNTPVQKKAYDIRDRAIKVMGHARYLLNLTEYGWKDTEEMNKVHSKIHQEQIALNTILDEHLALHLQELATTKQIITNKYRQIKAIFWSSIISGMLIALYMTLYMAKTVLTPISVLREGAKHIGNGNLDHDLSVTTGDEFEELAGEFKSMARKLADSCNELDRKILARTHELSQAISYLKKEVGERIKAEEEQHKAETQVHLLTQELLKIQEIERKRISLDLHDNVAQELSALKVMSETLFADPSTDQVQLQDKAAEWTEVLKHSIRTVRELSYNLWPSSLEQMGIKTALAEFCRDFSKNNKIPVEFTAAGMEKISIGLNYDIAINLYRLVQEALNNIKNHASTSEVQVKLVASGPNIVLQIEDNGQGFDLDKIREKALNEKRFGLLGMQERVNLLAGSFKISSRPGAGTRLFIEIPWNTGEKHEEKNHNH